MEGQRRDGGNGRKIDVAVSSVLGYACRRARERENTISTAKG